MKVETSQSGLSMAESVQRLYSRHKCLAGPVVYQATSGEECGILIKKYSSKRVYITRGKAIAIASEHTVFLMERNITHGESFASWKRRTFIIKVTNKLTT